MSLDILQNYMLISDNIKVPNMREDNLIKVSQNESVKNVENTNANNIFFPQEKDQLFWCFYMAFEGKHNYDHVDNNSFKVEKQIKISAAEQLHKNADILKGHKLKRVEVESDLVNNSKISLQSIHALCILHNISILYVTEFTYSEISCGSKLTSCIIKQNDKYGFFEYDDEFYKKIKETHFYIENISKPMRGISSYKSKDLQDICNKLNISLATKPVMYQAICEKID